MPAHSFYVVVEQLCNVRKCFLLKKVGDIFTIRSSKPTLASDIAYFDAVCDCYMATMEGTTAWIADVNFEECTFKLGFNW